MKNLNAAEIMEMRRQAEELLKQAEEMNKQYEEQRIIAIQYHKQQLSELGAEDVQTIEVTKEDNSTIEMLRETIRQMNETINDMNKEIEELKDEVEVKDAIIGHLKEQLKAEKEKAPRVIYVEVADDHTYDNETESEEEVVEQVEEIIVPATKEEKPKVTSGLLFDIKKTHDAVKAKITEGNKTFYAVWSVNDKAPAYSYVDKPNHYCRAKEWWKYDKLVKPELKATREELMNELKDKKNKNNTRKPVVKETPEEITIPTNDTCAFDDMEFC